MFGLCCVPRGPWWLGAGGRGGGGRCGWKRTRHQRPGSGAGRGWLCRSGENSQGPVSLWTASPTKWPEPRVAAWSCRGKSPPFSGTKQRPFSRWPSHKLGALGVRGRPPPAPRLPETSPGSAQRPFYSRGLSVALQPADPELQRLRDTSPWQPLPGSPLPAAAGQAAVWGSRTGRGFGNLFGTGVSFASPSPCRE